MTAFDYHIPSVFVISSPFQALCCVSAIRNLLIEDYIVIFFSDSKERKHQVENVLSFYKIQYEMIEDMSFFCSISFYFKSLFWKRNSYMRLFIGDFRQHLFIRIGLCLVSNGSQLVYLDDGNITVSLLKNTYKKTLKVDFVNFLNNITLLIRDIKTKKNLYTIYSDINNALFSISENKLNNIFVHKDDLVEKSGVYVIGTVIDAYCQELSIPKSLFLDKIISIFDDLKLSNNKIVYIAHGRDDGELMIPLCKKYQIEYVKPDMMVELYIANLKLMPALVIGFNSSALYNIKKMIPFIDIKNYIILPPQVSFAVEENNAIADYYVENGIPKIIFYV